LVAALGTGPLVLPGKLSCRKDRVGFHSFIEALRVVGESTTSSNVVVLGVCSALS
jgi:hypothetical protein